MSVLPWLILSLTDGLGPILTRRLVEKTGSAEAAVDVSQSVLRTVEGVGTSKALVIHQGLVTAREEAAKELDRAAAMNVAIVHVDDERYPTLLRAIHGPPTILYVRGTLEPRDMHSVGIVGSRKCGVYGREQAEKFGASLAGVGICVISGGARGIDTYAHQGALVPKNGRTIAVLGCGVDIAYPPENAPLFAKIAAAGAVISEFPLGTPPTAENFPRRNRIVSGLSRGILVVEADINSGALITARYANEDHNRPVFAVPGRVDNPLSAGPHRLIRDGAILAESLTDIIDNLGPLPDSVQPSPTLFDTPAAMAPTPKAERNLPPLSARQQSIVEALQAETLDIDALSERTSFPPHVVLQELTMLSLRGDVKRVEGQRFSIGRR